MRLATTALTGAAILAAAGMGCRAGAQDRTAAHRFATRPDTQDPLPACEWCGAPEAPTNLTATAVLAGPAEPGVRLVVTGTVYRPAGRPPVGGARSPAPGVLVYAYHTNARGVYPRRGDETGNGRRHGYLRGWLRTDARGRYRFETIRPAPYPTRDGAAHIHMTVTPPGGAERWLQSVHFADDPLLTPAARVPTPDHGGPGLVRVTRDAAGVQHAVRDVVLEAWP
jgi:protocatechuate 3,4-dioxygenase beta subunit